jgi:hypothetical protein
MARSEGHRKERSGRLAYSLGFDVDRCRHATSITRGRQRYQVALADWVKPLNMPSL